MTFLVSDLNYFSLKRIDLHTMLGCKITYYLSYVFGHSTVWTLIMMTAEKCYTVLFPYRAKKYSSTKSAKIVCSCVILFWAVYHSQLFFTFKKYDLGTIVYCYFNMEKYSSTYAKFYAIFDAVMYCYLSFTLISIFNAIIITKLFLGQKGKNIGTTENILSKTARSTSLMLVSVSICFLVLTIPGSVTFVMHELGYNIDVKIYHVVSIPFYINHGINAMLYGVVAPKFRREGIKFLCSWRKGRVEPSSTSTMSSEAT